MTTGSLILDGTSETGINAAANISSGLSSGTGTKGSASLSASSTHLFFRLRVAGNPADGTGGGLEAYQWLVQLATQNSACSPAGSWCNALSVGIDGKSNTVDEIYAILPNGTRKTTISSTTGTSPNMTLPGTRVQAASGVDGGTDYLIDWQIALSDISMVMTGSAGCGGSPSGCSGGTTSYGTITSTTPIRIFYGTSVSNNVEVINKDFMTGSSVCFSGCTGGDPGTVTPTEARLTLSAASSHVSGPNPPQTGLTSTYDLTYTATNGGGNPMGSISVTDTLPSGVSIISTSSATGSISASGQQITWNPSILAIGASTTATARVSVAPAGSDLGNNITLSSGASGSGTDSNSGAVSTANSSSVSVGPVAASSTPAISVGTADASTSYATEGFIMGQTSRTFSMPVTLSSLGSGTTTLSKIKISTSEAGSGSALVLSATGSSGTGGGTGITWSATESGGAIVFTPSGSLTAGQTATFTVAVSSVPGLAADGTDRIFATDIRTNSSEGSATQASNTLKRYSLEITDIAPPSGTATSNQTMSPVMSVANRSTASHTLTAADTSIGGTAFTSTGTEGSMPSIASGGSGSVTYSSATITSTTGSKTVTGSAANSTTATAPSHSESVTVGASGGLDHFDFSTITDKTAGSQFTVTVTAKDSAGNTITDYSGSPTVATTMSSSTEGCTNDAGCAPAKSLGSFSNGQATLTATGYKAETARKFTVTDGSVASDSNTFAIAAAALDHFAVSLPGTATAGDPTDVTVTAHDDYGNTVTSFTGAVSFTSTDASATLPATYTFISGDNGTHTFSAGVTFETAGTQSVTATGATKTGTSNDVTVQAAAEGATNSAPTAAVTLEDPAPRTNDVLTAGVTASDADGDTVSVAFVWKIQRLDDSVDTVRTVTKTAVAGATSDSLRLAVSGNGDKGETIVVQVTPSDGTDSGVPDTDSGTVVADTPPTATARIIRTAIGESKTIVLEGSDIDGENVTFQITDPPAAEDEDGVALAEDGNLVLSDATPDCFIASGTVPGTMTCHKRATYTPPTGATGSVTFRYSVQNGDGGLREALVTIEIEADPATGTDQTDSAEQETVQGAVVSTGAQPSADDPTETMIIAVRSGRIEIIEEPLADSTSAPSGFLFFGQQVRIGVYDEDDNPVLVDADDPMHFTFLLDSSILPEGETVDDVAVYRDGDELSDCTGGSDLVQPLPACVLDRDVNTAGAIEIDVLTTAASTWKFAVPVATDGGGSGGGGANPSPSISPSPTEPPPPRPLVRLRISDSTPRRGESVMVRTRLANCEGHEGTLIKLGYIRGGAWALIDVKRLDGECRAQWKVKVDYKKRTYQTLWAQQDDDHRAGKSRLRDVIPHGRLPGPRVKLFVNDETPRIGDVIVFRTRIGRCAGLEGDRIQLWRLVPGLSAKDAEGRGKLLVMKDGVYRKLRTKRVNGKCYAEFKVAVDFQQATFRTIWSNQDPRYRQGRAEPVTVRAQAAATNSTDDTTPIDPVESATPVPTGSATPSPTN